MYALCVDDEQLLLADLVRAVELSKEIDTVASFNLCSKALEWAQTNRPDIAFLDIQMRGMTGIELAERLREMYPDLIVVFCTGYREYAYDAFKIHGDGYLVKPITNEAVEQEISVLLSKRNAPTKKETRIKAQCFGNFEIFFDGTPLKFQRKRSKEVLAYLIDRKGSSVSTKEVCAVLWEDEADEKNIAILYKLYGDIRKTFSEIGMEDVIIKNNYEYAVNVELIDCDYYKYLAGDAEAEKAFTGEYMSQYSWAEETSGLLFYK